jgi:CheY-like chemotaxis protein
MPRKLLLADDSITIQKVVAITLAAEDFAITAVDNGEDAVTRARDLKPDIVLADVVMPRKSGYEVCEAIKADPSLRHIPVLLLAGTFEAFDEGRARAASADGHIQKPFESQALIDKVNALLGKPVAKAQPSVMAPVSSAPIVAPTPAMGMPRPQQPSSVAPRPAFGVAPPSQHISRPPTPVAPLGARPVPPPAVPPPGSPVRPVPGPAIAARPPVPGVPPGPRPVPPAGVRPPVPGAPPAGVAGVQRPTYPPAPRPPVPGVPPPSRPVVPPPAVARPPVPAYVSPPARPPTPPPGIAPSAVPGPTAAKQRDPFGLGLTIPPPRAVQVPAPPAPVVVPPRVEAKPPPPEKDPLTEDVGLGDFGEPTIEPSPELKPFFATPPPPVKAPAPVVPAAVERRPSDGGEALLREALSKASREVIERIAWEVVPQLAETIIREELERLIKDREAKA